jgi:hypothetical protein
VEEAEEQTHSFVIKFWVEEIHEEMGRVVWRGHITHVSSGEQSYIKELDSIIGFIAPFLEGGEVQVR